MYTAIIVAGGSGKRMGAEIPKQFLPLCGKPILMHTLERFIAFDADVKLILALPADQSERWRQLCVKHNFTARHTLVHGGDTRFMSVLNALSVTSSEGLIAVHDGVRPFVSCEVIARCFEEARKSGAATPVVAPVDSLRRIEGNESFALDRSMFRMVQTPQVFDAALLKTAYNYCSETSNFTDDASVVEHYGHRISLVEGNRENIKITTLLDLTVAEAIAQKFQF
ncbi:MAG: 2-C-methyl-D-erythritol 4-phosphate cytidylyltransferase [Prevotellaceae bacterium]|nr:2-C-methyl-D-erythritol 4-phosphate cytidylyltransferase [Prevotellaceae bacterium]